MEYSKIQIENYGWYRDRDNLEKIYKNYFGCIPAEEKTREEIICACLAFEDRIKKEEQKKIELELAREKHMSIFEYREWRKKDEIRRKIKRYKQEIIQSEKLISYHKEKIAKIKQFIEKNT